MFSWLFRTKAKKPKIAIVGAGLSGLAAASTLEQGGVDVSLFEAENHAGGRMLTHHTDWALIDHGAQYFTVRDPHFRSQVERWLGDGVVKIWEFEPYSFEDGLLRPSPDREVRYVGVGGMQHLPTALASNLDVRYGHEIRAVDSKGSLFNLRSSQNALPELFDAVILALPAPRIEPLLSATSALRETLATVRYEPAWSVALGFDNASTNTGVTDVGGIFTKIPEISWISHNSAKPSRRGRDLLDTWLIQFNPQWSASHRDIPPRQLQVLANGLLTRVLQRSLGMPVAYDLLYWPQARLAGTGCAPATVLREEGRHLYCCGDWTVGGRIEDAYMSGYRTAKAILEQWNLG